MRHKGKDFTEKVANVRQCNIKTKFVCAIVEIKCKFQLIIRETIALGLSLGGRQEKSASPADHPLRNKVNANRRVFFARFRR